MLEFRCLLKKQTHPFLATTSSVQPDVERNQRHDRHQKKPEFPCVFHRPLPIFPIAVIKSNVHRIATNTILPPLGCSLHTSMALHQILRSATSQQGRVCILLALDSLQNVLQISTEIAYFLVAGGLDVHNSLFNSAFQFAPRWATWLCCFAGLPDYSIATR